MITPEQYAKAYKEVSNTSSVDEAAKGLIATLTARGALSLLPRIVSVLERMHTESESRGLKITVARKSDSDFATKNAKELFGSTGRVVVDDTIIGGYVITKDSDQVDASYKTALLKLYHSFIS